MAGPHVCRLIPCVPGGGVCVLACPSMVMLIITLSHILQVLQDVQKHLL